MVAGVVGPLRSGAGAVVCPGAGFPIVMLGCYYVYRCTGSHASEFVPYFRANCMCLELDLSFCGRIYTYTHTYQPYMHPYIHIYIHTL